MTEKPDFENFDSILENFDKFCDEFETRAAEAFMRGDQNNGKVVRAATEKLGGETPSAVAEIGELGAEGGELGETDDRV
tara:strand:- start:115 stop:351 length:237 start_codon:yes stop_codon:yes gene_type:complete